MAKAESFDTFTKKWIEYVKKADQTIKEEDWNLFFAQTNPVAGIDRGALVDSYTDNKGNKIQANERQTIKKNWRNISQKFSELYELKGDEEIKKH
jgi:hypothetical protein